MDPTPGFPNIELFINSNDLIPEEYHLSQNFPNPFNPSTTIHYSLPRNNFVHLRVIDLEGREVKTLINGFQTRGNKSITWNAKNNQGRPASAGMYFYLIESGEFFATRKMILIK